MKPTNLNKETCSPISSNCVIWQGPDIPCIKLCKGDSVSEVVFKLATELCSILDTLNITSYDLSCFNITACGPQDFQQLIQFLIDKLCEEENITPTTRGTRTEAGACPDCLITVARCFQTGDDTVMQLTDYVIMIGTRVCQIASQISTINNVLVDHQSRIETLEDQFPIVIPPINVTPLCVLPPSPTAIQNVVTALEQQFCDLRNATGLPAEIFTAIAQACSTLDSLNGLGPLTAFPNWAASANAAAAINNLWISLCDIRAAIQNIQVNCCPGACSAVEIQFTAAVSGTDLILYYTGSIPVGWVECSPGNQVLTVTDCYGGTATVPVSVLGTLNLPGGYAIPLASMPSVNPSCNLSMTLVTCFEDPLSGQQCNNVDNYVLALTVACPTVSLSLAGFGYDAVAYTVNYSGIGTFDVEVQIYDSSGTVLISSDSYPSQTGVFTITDVFSGLLGSTTYKVRVLTTVNGNTNACPWNNIATDSASLPVVTTATIGSIGSTSAVSGGDVTSESGAPVTAKGVCYSTTPGPTILDTITIDGLGLGAFISTMTPLTPSTLYYVRAYATNSTGTDYGPELTFTTLP
jgi:hypothetical protein